MAAWTNLTDAVLSIAKPFTYVIARAMRDNAIAIAEGAVGAPRVVVPTALSTAETDASKVLGPNGSGGMSFRFAASPVSANQGVKTAPQASAQTIIASLPAGRHALRLTCLRCNLGGTTIYGGSVCDVILNTNGTPQFESVHKETTLAVALVPPEFAVATFTVTCGGGGGTTGTMTYTATSSGVTATWTNDVNYILTYAHGLKAI